MGEADDGADGSDGNLRHVLEAALRENEAANDNLRNFLVRHRDSSRGVVTRLISGEHAWSALENEDAAERRDGYVSALRRFEDSRRELRMLVILWAKRYQGLSYRSIGPRFGVSEQMAAKLGQEASKRYPD